MKKRGGILLLAAGESKRFGSAKQLFVLEGKMLLQRAIDVVVKVPLDHRFCAIGANHFLIKSNIDFGICDTIFVPSWNKGMGETISKSIHFITKKIDLDYIIISVADQPHLQLHTFSQMISQNIDSPKQIIYSKYEKGYGVPMLIPKKYFKDLKNLNEDVGAKSFIAKIKQDCLSNPFPKGHLDIDIPEDISGKM